MLDCLLKDIDVLLKNILSEAGPIKIKNGDLKLKLSPEILVWLTKENYIKYHYVIKDIIPKSSIFS